MTELEKPKYIKVSNRTQIFIKRYKKTNLTSTESVSIHLHHTG